MFKNIDMLESEDLVRIYLPDCDDNRILEVLERRKERFLSDGIVETKLVICGKESEKERFKDFWEYPFFEFQLVPDDKSNVRYATERLKGEKTERCGMLAGNISSTSEVVGAIIQTKIERVQDVKRISSYFLMKHREHGDIIFSDSGLAPNPTAEELAEIAQLSTENAAFHGIKERKIVFLRAGHDAEKMEQAREIFLQRNKDSSLKVCEVLSAEEATEQGANIFVFPNLDAGNIAYKMCERLDTWDFADAEIDDTVWIISQEISQGGESIVFTAPLSYEAPNTENILTSFSWAVEKFAKKQSALLSFSTDQSGFGKSTKDLLTPAMQATESLASDNAAVIPKIVQFDTAFLPEIAKKKGVETTWRVEHYHFQSRQSFDICMWLAASLGGSQALGPFLQWLAKQANDTSRGIWVDEMEAMLQMIKEKCLLRGK